MSPAKDVPFFLKPILMLSLLIGALSLGGVQAEDVAITVYKDPDCGCCTLWEQHLEANGFRVDSRETRAMGLVKAQVGLPRAMASCHTAIVDGVIVEGHVPAEVVHRFLAERPAGAVGIAAPGMPLGSPGMEMPDGRTQPYDVMAFDAEGRSWVYSSHNDGQ
ncbi:DUF411 domain-containing protein [Ectothiorhodospira shaposhnikovii]|uniref:DUF411 domain-containing protein n=1 Tax=Ectothiorhodospira shaposhnikovii TaxID=1054 RepID=UPI001EE8A0F5|nr:DUF411 domain-containing protein [Ectothiorhodospira shaposhnikovii]MCG5513856.1 DUF411 domain-containing protein [Ectothiorhodospira shaposhnikovii]